MSSSFEKHVGLALVGAALAAPASAQTAAPVAPTSQPVVTVTKVKTPWYGFAFLLRRGFRKAVPEYQKIDGLDFKYFASTSGGKIFGGIYRWESEAQARSWFGDAWFARVRQTYKTEGEVRYYPLLSEKQFVPEAYDYAAAQRHSVAVFLHAATATAEQQATAGAPGLLRLYVVGEGADARGLVLLFASEAAAANYLAARPAGQPELFQTPVLLRNRPAVARR